MGSREQLQQIPNKIPELLFCMFELEPFEVLVFTIILWVMRFLVGFALAAMLIAAVGGFA